MKYRFENIVINENGILLEGWLTGRDPSAVNSFSVTDADGGEVQAKIVKGQRNDVSMAVYGESHDNLYGFSISFSWAPEGGYVLRMQCGGEENTVVLNRRTLKKLQAEIKLRRYIAPFIQGKVFSAARNKSINYEVFRKLADFRVPSRIVYDDDSPLFSIIIPLYETPEEYLRELLESITQQSYKKYEVCLADGSRPGKDVSSVVRQYQAKDQRIKYRCLNKNKGISGNTNEALAMAEGDFIVLCDHDDMLEKDALYWLAEAVRKEPECDCIYSDEDKVDETGKRYFDPHFKPDYNIDLLCSVNYICHIFAVRKSLCDEYGGFRSEYDGAQDYDFILRMTEKARKTVHVPKVLYHWRTHTGSTSENPQSKLYAYEAGAKAIREHYRRVWPKLGIEKIETGISLGIYHTYFETDDSELISVIIPNKDHTEDLDKAIRSMIERGTWRNLEFIIAENNSEEEETFRYYEEIQREYPQVKVVRYEGGFNYSRINNFAEKYAKGKYILMMNNDVELIEKDSMREMVGYLQREDVGAVGCRLLYEDDTIQHAGVVVGIGTAEHILKNTLSGDGTYYNRAMTAQDYSAVTAAVMMMKREDYETLGGFDESFAVAFNDIDLCLRIRESGKLIVYDPYACFHHYESRSRGAEDTPEKKNRFFNEISRFVRRWYPVLKEGDPYYNPNLSITRNDFALRNLTVDKIGSMYYSKKDLKMFFDGEKEN